MHRCILGVNRQTLGVKQAAPKKQAVFQIKDDEFKKIVYVTVQREWASVWVFNFCHRHWNRILQHTKASDVIQTAVLVQREPEQSKCFQLLSRTMLHVFAHSSTPSTNSQMRIFRNFRLVCFFKWRSLGSENWHLTPTTASSCLRNRWLVVGDGRLILPY